jgi:branched-chain amino acid transport system ATP-binding protein
VLEVSGLRKSFGHVVAVSGVSLSLAEGEVRAVIGPNGAGKSTLFGLIAGALRPDSGTIAFRGDDVTGRPSHAVATLGVGRSYQVSSIFPGLTLRENVRVALLARRRRPLDVWVRASRLAFENDEAVATLARVGLAERAEKPAARLSHGDKKLLELAIVLARRPSLLLLDEPTAGMNPVEAQETVALVARVAREAGMTVLFTEHDMAVVFRLARRVTVLHQGAIIADGAPGEIRAHPEVRRAYLGDERWEC